jgi:hypothetical protein
MHKPPSIGLDLFTTSVGLLGGLAIAYLLDRSKWLSWMNGDF